MTPRRRVPDAMADPTTDAVRVTIAGELHDLVAHHVSTALVQANAADRLLPSDRLGAAVALAAARESTREALDELCRLRPVLAQAERTAAGA